MKTLGLTNVVSQLERTKSQLAQYIEQDEGVVVVAAEAQEREQSFELLEGLVLADTVDGAGEGVALVDTAVDVEHDMSAIRFA